MRRTRLHAACVILGVLRLASVSEGLVVTGTRSRLMRHRRAANSATLALTSQQRGGTSSLTMGAAGKKRKKVIFGFTVVVLFPLMQKYAQQVALFVLQTQISVAERLACKLRSVGIRRLLSQSSWRRSVVSVPLGSASYRSVYSVYHP